MGDSAVNVLVEVRAEDFDVFWKGFRTRGLPLRQRHGSIAARVFRDTADDRSVKILFDWASQGRFERFLADPEVRESMQRGGALGPPAVTFLEVAGALEA